MYKILHIGFSNPALGRAFSAKCEYRFIDWTLWTSIPNNINALHAHILEACVGFDPDMVFMQIQAPGVITAEFAARLPGLVINWTWDFNPNLSWAIELGRVVNVTAFTNEEHVDIMKKKGLNAMFLQGGFDPDVYKPTGSTIEAPAVVFMANNYPTDDYDYPLAGFREDLVRDLKAGFDFEVYGFGWPGQNPLQSFMHREQKEAECYRSAKLAINLSHFEAERYTSDRMFRILGTGVMCLTHWYPGIDKDFVNGEQLEVWKDRESLFELIDRYIYDSEARQKIARAGCELAHSNYTWAHMVDNILKLL